jgi:hypothetical protein
MPGLHYLVELYPELLNGYVSVGAGVVGGGLGNGKCPFGLIHCILACGIISLI